MRFEELILRIGEDELRIRFHARLTLLAGLDPSERQELSGVVVGALVGGAHKSVLRYHDGTGEPVELVSDGGTVRARRPDASTGGPPPGTIGLGEEELRSLLVVGPEDLREKVQPPVGPEPAELTEARTALAELDAAVEAATDHRRRTDERRAELDTLDAALRSARDNASRRQHADVLAQLEQVRAEAAALDTDEQDVERDRELLQRADALREQVVRWGEAVTAAAAAQADGELASDEDEEADDGALVVVPPEPPVALEELVDELAAAASKVAIIEQRLQDLAVARLPTPSEPLVAELGLLAQGPLWLAAERLKAGREALHHLQLSLGGLEVSDLGPPPTQIAGIEQAHGAVEAAERSLEASRSAGTVGAAGGLVVAAAGLVLSPILVVVGLIGAVAAGGIGLLLPRLRLARASRAEQAALSEAEADSYLGFHIRRVEASIDPRRRDVVAAAVAEHEQAQAAWHALAGPEVDVDAAAALADEIETYHAAVQELGDTAEEMDQLRQQLHDQARPAWSAARAALAGACAPYLVADEQLDDPQLVVVVRHQCRRGARARRREERSRAEAEQHQRSSELEAALVDLGLDGERLGLRAGDPSTTAAALDALLDDAAERDRSRRRARPRAEIAREVEELRAQAAALDRPEWQGLPPLEGDAPDVAALEARRAAVEAQLAADANDPAAGGPSEAELERLTDRRAATARRVAALEANRDDGRSEPIDVSEVHSRLLARLTRAAQAGPDGDPVPLLLDDALLHVPADRRWDVLDLLLRLAEQHQVIYLTGDPFVAAWGHQHAGAGDITLWEPIS